MIIATERLALRPVQAADLHQIHRLHSLPETDEYNTLGIPNSLHETEQVLQDWLQEIAGGRFYVFVIEQPEGQEFIGLIALRCARPVLRRAEVWYKLHKDHWNQGYATRALNMVLAFGFRQLNLHRIEAGCAVDNTASVRVMEKVGMSREGSRRKALPLKTGWSDNYEYAILKEEYVARQLLC